MGFFGFKKKEPTNIGSPLRGYMNMAFYSVVGTNPTTGRQKTVKAPAINADAALRSSGLVSAMVTEVAWEPATDRQIAYAKKCGIKVPKNATMDDASALLTRCEDGEVDGVPAGLVLAAAQRGVAMSYFVGRTQYNYMMSKAPEKEDDNE